MVSLANSELQILMPSAAWCFTPDIIGHLMPGTTMQETQETLALFGPFYLKGLTRPLSLT